MGLFGFYSRKEVEERSAAAVEEYKSTQLSTEQILDRLDGLAGYKTGAGVHVSEGTAVQASAVLACVRVLAEGVAQLPLKVYRKTGPSAKVEASDRPIYSVLAREPNPWMTSFAFRETLMTHLALVGNAYAYKVFNGRGEVKELLPIMPGFVSVHQDPESYDVTYTVTLNNRVLGKFGPDRIFHMRGLSWDSVTGWEPIKLAREAIGLSLATEEGHSRMHANGAKLSGVFTTDKKLSPQALDQLRDYWAKHYAGTRNAGGTPVLDQGISFEKMSMTGVDAEHLATRRFQIEEVCRFFKVFPQMVMQSDKTSTYASAEAFFTAHLRHTIDPWLVRWEQEIDRQLLDAKGPLFAQFDRSELEKASMKDRGDFYMQVGQLGIYTRNELRMKEGLPPIEGLDEPLTPVNTAVGTEGHQDDAEQ